MEVMDAVAWGVAGGLASGILALMVQIVAAEFEWPWRNRRHQVGPRLFVFAGGLLLAGLMVGALHSQISGEWAAFIQGLTAPLILRRLLSGVEVTERFTATESANSSLGSEAIGHGGPDGVQ